MQTFKTFCEQKIDFDLWIVYDRSCILEDGMNNKKLAFFLIFIMIVTLMGTSGCGAAKISDEKSPCLENVFLKTYNNGSESSQFVEVTLRFDREIAAGKKILSNMKVTISGTRMTDITA